MQPLDSVLFSVNCMVQRLSAKRTTRHSHADNRQTEQVGIPLQPLSAELVILALTLQSSNLPVDFHKLSIYVDGRDIASAGHNTSKSTSSAIWTIKPPLPVAFRNVLSIRPYHERSFKRLFQKPVGSLEVPVELLFGICKYVIPSEPIHVPSKRALSVSLTIQTNTLSLITSTQGNIAMLNSSKAFARVLLRLRELQHASHYIDFAPQIQGLSSDVQQVAEIVEKCPTPLFDRFERLGESVHSSMHLLSLPRCLDRPKTCPLAIASALALARNLCLLIKCMSKTGEEGVNKALSNLLDQFMLALKRARRNLEERKNEALFTDVYIPNSTQNQRILGDPCSGAGSRSTLSLNQQELLDQLEPQFLPTGYVPSLCADGTRADVFRDIELWLDDSLTSNVLWISSGPGTGKTSLAWSIANKLDRKQRNASFFLFRHMRSRPADLWRTVACNLALYHPALKSTISTILEEDFDFDCLDDVHYLFKKLIFNPLRQHSRALLDASTAPVFVICSLDVCLKSSKSDWHALLETIALWSDMPKTCKLIFTSCHDEDMERRLGQLAFKRIQLLPEDAFRDIQLFVERRASDIPLPPTVTKFNEIHLTEIVKHAGGFFLWARSAMDYVASSADPPRALERLALRGMHHKLDDVDQVFDHILSDAFDDIKPSGFRTTLGAIAFAYRPVSITELKELLGGSFSVPQALAICSSLSAILTVTNTGQQRLQVYHTAFVQYLTGAQRVGSRHENFLIDSERTHQRFMESCLQRLLSHEDGLRFGLCKFGSSYAGNNTIGSQQHTQAFSSSLEYACKFWSSHLLATTNSIGTDVIQYLRFFFRDKLLFWIEAMSCLGSIGSASRAMILVANRIEQQAPDVSALARETARFIFSHTDVIASSTAHLYISALAFLPTDSILQPCFAPFATCAPRYTSNRSLVLQPIANMYSLPHKVTSICMSPDGTWALAAQELQRDPVLTAFKRLDLVTGAVSGDTYVEESVMNIKLYLEDGEYRAASAGTDRTVKLWDLSHGIRLLSAFEGHSDYVRCLDVDQTRLMIVSGSDDCTLIVWSLTSQQPAVKPFGGHKDWIRAALFVEKGSRIVSGSDDHSIRIWDTATGVQLRRIDSHGSPVRSLALWGSSLVSGGNDGTIVVSALDTGSELYRQPRAHLAYVSTLLCGLATSNGAVIASGAADGTVQFWDGFLQPLGDRLYLHKGAVIDISVLDCGIITTDRADQDGSLILLENRTPEDSGGALHHEIVPFDKTHYGSNMGSILLVQACSDGGDIIAVDHHGIWQWSSSGLVSQHDFFCESEPYRGPARIAALSADERTFALALDDGYVCIGEATSGRVLYAALHAHNDEIEAMALSGDGKYLVSAATDGTISLWDTANASRVAVPKDWTTRDASEMASHCVAVTPTHCASALHIVRLFAIGVHRTVELVDNGSDDREATVFTLTFSQDAFTLGACFTSGRVVVWDVFSGAKVYTRTMGMMPAEELLQATFSPSLEAIAYIPQGPGKAAHEYHVLNVKAGTVVEMKLGHSSPPSCAAFLLDETKLVTGTSEGVLRMGCTAGLACYVEGPKHDDSVRALAFSPNGRYLASGDDLGEIVLWDAWINEQVNTVHARDGEWVRALAFTSDGMNLLSAGDDCKIRAWRIPTLEPLYEFDAHTEPIRALAFSSSGCTLVTASEDRSACFWELPKSAMGISKPVQRGDFLWHTDKVLCVALDDVRFVTGSADGVITLRISKSNQWKSTCITSHQGAVNTLKLLSDGLMFISGGEDGTLRLWDVSTGISLRTIEAHSDVVHAITEYPGPDRLVFSASRDAKIYLWDPQTGAEAALPLRTHSAAVLQLALSPDGRRLASADSNGRVIVHDVASTRYAWPHTFERSAPVGGGTICVVDRQGMMLGAQLDDDGWVRGRCSELLFWIPPTYRFAFSGPSCIAMLGPHPTVLDLRAFVHGNAWLQAHAN